MFPFCFLLSSYKVVKIILFLTDSKYNILHIQFVLYRIVPNIPIQTVWCLRCLRSNLGVFVPSENRLWVNMSCVISWRRWKRRLCWRVGRSGSWGTPWKELSRRRRPRGRTRCCWRVRDRESRATGRRSSTGRWGAETRTHTVYTQHIWSSEWRNDMLFMFRFSLCSQSCSLKKRRSMRWRLNCTVQTETSWPLHCLETGQSSRLLKTDLIIS